MYAGCGANPRVTSYRGLGDGGGVERLHLRQPIAN